MIQTDHILLSNLIFAFTEDDLDMVIIEFIKLHVFEKKQCSTTLHSLEYQIHKHANSWLASYQYTTQPDESVYFPPIYNIAILVPQYTTIFVTYISEEKFVAEPPEKKRRLLQKPKRRNQVSVFSSYTEV